MIKGSNIERNEAIINTLIEVAHEQQRTDKQEVFQLSIDFINKRLISIKNEIDSLTLKMTGYKSENLIFSPDAQTGLALNNLSTLDQKVLIYPHKKNLPSPYKAILKIKRILVSYLLILV